MTVIAFPNRAICACADCNGSEFITIQGERLPCPTCRHGAYVDEARMLDLIADMETAGAGGIR